MATVDDGWQTIVNLAAKDGSIRPVILTKSDAADEAAMETLYAAWLVDYAVVGAGNVKSWSHAHHYHDDAFVLPTDNGAERGEYAIIVTNISGDATKTAIINLPFPRDTTGVVFVDDATGRNTVLVSSTALANYLDNFETAGYEISDGEHSAGNVIRGKRAGT